MANTYVILSASTLNDVCTITGTVNGTFVTIEVWATAVNHQPNTTALENFLAPIMLAAATPTQGTNQLNVTSLGTFTQ
jgi:hypothetical protein